MASKLVSKPSSAPRHDDLDNYDVDDFSDDPFASPPENTNAKKRKEPDSGLGIDEEVNVQKRARAPNVKLDEERLLGPKGIPKLRKRAKNLRIKGKGHEFSDAARLLSFYQLWLDDLFPKAKFLDALAMIEKAGHKKRVMIARNNLINEDKPKSGGDDDEDGNMPLRSWEVGLDDDDENAPAAAAAEGPKTPSRNDDVPDDDDLYDATPRQPGASIPIRTQVPNEDGLETLIAEAEGQGGSRKIATAPPLASKLNGNAEDEDDLDALIAEVEAQDQGSQKQKEPAKTTTGTEGDADEFADAEAAMQEMEGLW